MGFIRRCIRRLKWRTKTGDVMNHDIPIHEGIKTIGVENDCDFSSSSELCICIVTWNMNGQVSYGDIKELVGRDRKFHLLVVGLQEAPRNNISRFLQEALVETHILFRKAIMQSVQLYVFGLKNSELFIQAHTSNVEERNSQFRHISSSLFSKNLNPYARPDQITIWLGDLNYRLQGINTFPARSLIRKNLHELLTSKDQLLQEAERGQIFSGYCEGTLAFKPTYKYDIGSSSYDTSHKVRVPSWTDRILFKIEDIDKINATLHSYESIETIHSSDHRPVKAHLCLKLNTQPSPISNKVRV
ncbi:type IV inositol polyphosphate 5-phosphatase 11 isoform X3 [Actinidia eriantha]|uniref:type IV inositol polyphosphate 5-phosphatase 11 isoform X3 n=1 Tax=Actinidia eriantha TaxID=165200 RepID=UPI002587341A|nr:type IV inositol polyphosphate 5-phosphatase 11 isoform X3 [Actinidia eriantha]